MDMKSRIEMEIFCIIFVEIFKEEKLIKMKENCWKKYVKNISGKREVFGRDEERRDLWPSPSVCEHVDDLSGIK